MLVCARIYEGLPYVTQESHDALTQKFYGGAEGWLKEQVRVGRVKPDAAAMTDDASSSSSAEKKEDKPKKQITLEREADIQYLQEVQSRIFAWLASRAADEHELLLPEANSFLRLSVHQWFETLTQDQLSAKVPNATRAHVFLETRSLPNQKWKSTFHVMHWTEAEKLEQEALALDKKRREFDAKVGFKLVWDLLRTARAPIVVHNGKKFAPAPLLVGIELNPPAQGLLLESNLLSPSSQVDQSLSSLFSCHAWNLLIR